MGKPTYARLPGQEERADETESFPLRPTRGPDEDEGELHLPSYDDSEAAAASSSGSAGAQYDNVDRPDRVLVTDPYPAIDHGGDSTIRLHPQLSEPGTLLEYIKTVIQRTPPRPSIRIVGSHNDSSKKKDEQRVVDFNITINLQRYLGDPSDRRFCLAYAATDADKVYRGGWRKVRAKDYLNDAEVGEDQTMTLEDWCWDFGQSAATLKTFRITHIVDGLDHEFLKTEIERVLRSTHYHGSIQVDFPVRARYVDIYSPHWINRLRHSNYIIFFFVTGLWLLIWPVLFFLTRRWSVYTVRWNWFYRHHESGQQEANKVFATVSEQRWVQLHQNLIMMLALEKFCGDASEFPINVPDERVARAIGGGIHIPGESNTAPAVTGSGSSVGLWNPNAGERQSWGGHS